MARPSRPDGTRPATTRHGLGAVLGHVAVAAKSNEIPAVTWVPQLM